MKSIQSLNLLWHDSDAKGYTDVLPLALLQSRGETKEAEHLCLGPKGGRYTVRFRLSVSDQVAELNYEAFPEYNSEQEMALGILRLEFANRDHTLLKKAQWKGEEETTFSEAEVTVERQDPEGDPDIVFARPDQKDLFFAWMEANPKGYVLNWPKYGVTASMHVVFHKSGCRVLQKKSFPTAQWHKVCDRSLPLLESWAAGRRRFNDAPSVHACDICFKGGPAEYETASRLPDDVPDLAVDDEPPERIEVKLLRIVRDTALAREVKRRHKMQCQLCPTIIELPGGGRYAEAHHLRPLGGGHAGLDREDNILVVCPTCHAKLDYGVIRLDRLKLREVEDHRISNESIEYHNSIVFGARKARAIDAVAQSVSSPALP